VLHAGAYFETRELVERTSRLTDKISAASCVIIEPIACEGPFRVHDVRETVRALAPGQILIVDETLSAPSDELFEVLQVAAGRGLVVARLLSGLKLLQQGLELANVGILNIYAEDEGVIDEFKRVLARCRTLTGAGLRFADALALDAPFFLE